MFSSYAPDPLFWLFLLCCLVAVVSGFIFGKHRRFHHYRIWNNRSISSSEVQQQNARADTEVGSPTTESPEPTDPSLVQMNDTVIYVFTNNPDRRISVTVTDNRYDPATATLPHGHPLARALLGVRKGSTINVPAGGKARSVVIVDIIKAATNSLTNLQDCRESPPQPHHAT